MEKELKWFNISVYNINHYGNAYVEYMKKIENQLKPIATDLNLNNDRVCGSVIILKRYVSICYRFLSFLRLTW